MTHLYLVRHGATVWHAENRYAGSTDIALDSSGLAQAERLGQWAPGAGLAAIWCSPLSRARATAEPAVRAIGLALQIDERLREVDFGLIEGMTIAEAEKIYPEEIQRFQADPVTYPMPGGEDPHAAARRGMAALRDIAAAHQGARVLIVAHNTFIRLLLCSVLEIPLTRYRTVFPLVRNGALTELGVRDDGETISLLQYNAPLAL